MNILCNISEVDNIVVVKPTVVGVFVDFVTFGLVRPKAKFNRDFGPDCFDGKKLFVFSGCDVNVNGDLYGSGHVTVTTSNCNEEDTYDIDNK